MRYLKTDDLQTRLKIRDDVFIKEQNVPFDHEVDGLDKDCLHYLGQHEDMSVATCRIRYIDHIAKIERVAVLKKHRGQGIGQELMIYVINDLIKDKNIHTIKLGAQLSAVDFYKRLGFEQIGDLYIDAGIEHIDMARKAS